MDLTPLSPVSPSPLSPPTTSTTTTQPHPQQQQPDSVTIKVVVPSSNVCKTVRLPVKIKVKELHDILTKKLSTVSNAPLHIYEDYGFYWHSDSGPVWLSDSATLRAYNFKPNVCCIPLLPPSSTRVLIIPYSHVHHLKSELQLIHPSIHPFTHLPSHPLTLSPSHPLILSPSHPLTLHTSGIY